MKKKYYVDRMVYTLHNSPIAGQKEYWETDIDPMAIQTEDIRKAVDRYYSEVEKHKDDCVKIALYMHSDDEDVQIECFSTMDPDILIRL